MEPNPVSKNKLTLLRKLTRKKYRQSEQLFTIEGERAVEQVIENRAVEVKGLYFDVSQRLWDRPEWQQMTHHFESYSVHKPDFLEVTDTDNPQGVLAVCQMPDEGSVHELSGGQGVIIATDGIQDPGNMGTILRTGSWFGIRGILAGKGTVDLFHPKVTRSTVGSMGVVPYINADLEELLPQFEQAGWKVVLLDAGSGARELKAMDKPDKVILVVGNEANGISKSLFADGRIKGRISSPAEAPTVESLNASIALSIALYAFSS